MEVITIIGERPFQIGRHIPAQRHDMLHASFPIGFGDGKYLFRSKHIDNKHTFVLLRLRLLLLAVLRLRLVGLLHRPRLDDLEETQREREHRADLHEPARLLL